VWLGRLLLGQAILFRLLAFDTATRRALASGLPAPVAPEVGR
jgi:hypothetical protein